MNEKNPGQSGGVTISGFVGKAGDIVGRDKITANAISSAELDGLLQPMRDAIGQAPAEVQQAAQAKVDALKQEAAKGEDAADGTMATLIDEFLKLVPAGVSGVVSAFASPILGGLAGPVTKFVLGKLKSE